MTTLKEDLGDVHPPRQFLALILAFSTTVPGIALKLSGGHINHTVDALLFGAAIVGAAFLLSWAAEVAQLDISAGLAIAVLALIAVLPEYAVDFVFASQGGNAVEVYGAACRPPGSTETSACSLALANMTGANRLLIGVGWSAVVFVAWYQWRRKGIRRPEGIKLARQHSVEVAFLAAATIYSLTLPLKHSITLVDSVILVGIFVVYTIRVSKAPAEEPHLVGPAREIGQFRTSRRRLSVIAMFLFSGAVILICAEPFAHALVETGKDLGVSTFLLVQWVAPLASESPELLVAILFAWKLNTDAGLGTLVSSKVNQWTLLVGTLPIVFAVSAGAAHGLPIEPRQREELLLTAAQSFFALAVLVSLSISVREAWMLFTLFWAQFILGAIVPESLHGVERIGVSVAYLALGIFILARNGRRILPLLRDGFRVPYRHLRGDEEE
ncbi:MAG: sodium:proton exchanger [Actinomycetota bacterium]